METSAKKVKLTTPHSELKRFLRHITRIPPVDEKPKKTRDIRELCELLTNFKDRLLNKEYHVFMTKDFCDASLIEPRHGCTHERYMLFTYPLFINIMSNILYYLKNKTVTKEYGKFDVVQSVKGPHFLVLEFYYLIFSEKWKRNRKKGFRMFVDVDDKHRVSIYFMILKEDTNSCVQSFRIQRNELLQ
jgi:hypothetical protein